MIQQRTLPIALNDEATFDNYFPGPNQVWLSYLQDFIAGNKEHYLYLWGEPGAGRSHLLQACCHACIHQRHTAVYINFQANLSLKPEILDNLEKINLICLDDIQQVLGVAEWEEALFHLYNRCSESSALLLISANVAPAHLTLHLADLASRLVSGVAVYLHNLTDEQKLLALELRTKRRGLTLPKSVGEFLLRHYPRDMTALFSALERLDQASLIAKRKLTVPFVKEVLTQ